MVKELPDDRNGRRMNTDEICDSETMYEASLHGNGVNELTVTRPGLVLVQLLRHWYTGTDFLSRGTRHAKLKCPRSVALSRAACQMGVAQALRHQRASEKINVLLTCSNR